ncbi:DUF397 domain-containing protein [Streptomyces sp. bgisy091]|uniref:DUF397 domain-containing protein n=1 Tax=Streptomyces sp. bgisy091 TaxID=3413778 RepID=UPI003D73B45F
MTTTESAWFKSSYSGGDGDSCVEVALTPAEVQVRDSKVEEGPRLSLAPSAWACFVAYAGADRAGA